MDLRIKDEGKLEPYKKASERLEKWASILFVHLRSESYLGRAWQYLTHYVDMKFMQQTSQLIFHLLTMCGDRLVLKYKKAFKKLLTAIVNEWKPKYEVYL